MTLDVLQVRIELRRTTSVEADKAQIRALTTEVDGLRCKSAKTRRRYEDAVRARDEEVGATPMAQFLRILRVTHPGS